VKVVEPLIAPFTESFPVKVTAKVVVGVVWLGVDADVFVLLPPQPVRPAPTTVKHTRAISRDRFILRRHPASSPQTSIPA
jgi:hypothetical protein